jgi:hypothetical protein
MLRQEISRECLFLSAGAWRSKDVSSDQVPNLIQSYFWSLLRTEQAVRSWRKSKTIQLEWIYLALISVTTSVGAPLLPATNPISRLAESLWPKYGIQTHPQIFDLLLIPLTSPTVTSWSQA